MFLHAVSGGAGVDPEALILIPMGMFVLAVCAMCHVLLLLRLKHLAATT